MTSTAPHPVATTPAQLPQPRRGSVRGLVVLALLLVLAGLLSLAVGSRRIPLGTVIDVLFHPDGSDASTIVHDLRIPRTVLALAVGICARHRRRADAGPHPQPARRPRACSASRRARRSPS